MAPDASTWSDAGWATELGPTMESNGA